MIDYIGMLREFHTKFGHFIGDRPMRHDEVPDEIVFLREKLIEEEFQEFKDAALKIDIADALGDLLYVVFGTALAYGIPIDEVFTEIHRSNMTKSMLKDEKSIPGKTLKGPDFSPCNLEPIIHPGEQK